MLQGQARYKTKVTHNKTSHTPRMYEVWREGRKVGTCFNDIGNGHVEYFDLYSKKMIKHSSRLFDRYFTVREMIP